MNGSRVLGFVTSLTLHLLAAAIVVLLAWSTPPQFTRGAVRPGPVVAFVEPSGGLSSGPHELAGSTKQLTSGEESSETPSDVSSSEFTIGGFRFDPRKISERATALFPFLTQPLSLDRVLRGSMRGDGNSFVIAVAPMQRRRSKPPLVLDHAAMQTLVDNAWSRRDRWKAFHRLVELSHTYSPDVGRLPAVFGAYGDQNLLQPYVDTTSRDPRLWAMLALAADSLDFVRFIERYISESPGTKASTELLFLLDKVAQGNHDALVALLDTDPEKELWWTRQTSRNAYNLIIEARRYYQERLTRRGLVAPDDLRVYYDEVRLAVLMTILHTTPRSYRANDARFLIGTIYWKQGRRADAVRVWRQLTIAPGDMYVTAYGDIVDVLNGPVDPSVDLVAAARVDGILASEHQRWLRFSTNRLRRFGYDVDAF